MERGEGGPVRQRPMRNCVARLLIGRWRTGPPSPLSTFLLPPPLFLFTRTATSRGSSFCDLRERAREGGGERETGLLDYKKLVCTIKRGGAGEGERESV